jgi:hypothetical protein
VQQLSGNYTVRSRLSTLPDTNNDCGDQWKTENRTVLDVSVKESNFFMTPEEKAVS